MNVILLCLILAISIVNGLPVQPPKDVVDSAEYDVVYVPYDIKYVPVEIPVGLQKLIKNSENNSFLPDASNKTEEIKSDDTPHIELSRTILASTDNVKDLSSLKKEVNNADNLEPIDHVHREGDEKEQNLVLVPLSSLLPNQKKLSEELLLIPERKLRKVDDKHVSFEDKGSSSRIRLENFGRDISESESHLVKRQAPGDALVLRPVVRFRRVFRSTKRVQRLPAFVGYLSDDDHFPTVA